MYSRRDFTCVIVTCFGGLAVSHYCVCDFLLVSPTNKITYPEEIGKGKYMSESECYGVLNKAYGK